MKKKACSKYVVTGPHFNLKIGTMNKNNPTTAYVEMSAYISPKENYKKYDEDVRDLNKITDKFPKKYLSNSNIFTKNFISTLDTPVASFKHGKKSYLTIEYTFVLQNPIAIENLEDEFLAMSEKLWDDIQSDEYISETFEFSKSRK